MTTVQSTSSPISTGEAADHGAPAQQRVLLMTITRGDARFCIRLGDVSEVGRLVRLTRMDGTHDAVLGWMVLHGETVPVIDAAVAIGAVREPRADPRMFAATRTQPLACIAFDEIVGKHEGDEKHAGQHSHELIHGLVAKGGQSLPVIDIPTIARLANGTALTSREAAAAIERDREESC